MQPTTFRLSLGGWLIAGTLTLGRVWLIPLAWQRIEPLGVESDYRVPYPLGNDYWHYERTCNEICRTSGAVLIGDSVLWGHYVEVKDTLSHYLNELLGRGPAGEPGRRRHPPGSSAWPA